METTASRPFFSVSRFEAIVICFMAAIALYVIVPLTKLNPAHNRAEIEYAQFHDKLKLGMTSAEVRQAFVGMKPKYLKLYVENNEGWVNTPSQISARNWRMILEFKSDKLTRVHSQIIDYDKFPVGAPPDKIVQP